MSRLFGIAAVQMEVVPWDPARTLDRMESRLEYLMRTFPWVRLACFPELYPTATAPTEPLPPGAVWSSSAEEMPGPLTERLAAMAQRFEIWLQPGSLYEREGDLIYNTAPVFSPDGALVTRYRKLFPWRPWETTAAGRDFCTFDIPDVGCFGLCICYDGWFPEVMRTLAWMGAEVILHPALSSTVDRPAELILEQAHAIFNQCYVINPNLASAGGTGRSIIVDPHGRVLQQAGTHEEVMVEMLDLDLVRDTRELGSVGLNQHLKQLRDFEGDFPIYSQGIGQGRLFRNLGPLELVRAVGPK